MSEQPSEPKKDSFPTLEAFTNLARKLNAQKSIFPTGAEDYDGRRGRSLERYLELTGFTLDELLSANRILDYGSGPEARLRDELAVEAKKLGMSEMPEVISMSPAYANAATRENLLKKTGNAEGVVAGEGVAVPFINGAFDRILVVHVLLHMATSEFKKALTEMDRILAPGGKIAIFPLLESLTSEDIRRIPHNANIDAALLARAKNEQGVERSEELKQCIHEVFPTPPYRIFVQELPRLPGDKPYKFMRLTIEKPFPDEK